MTKTQLADLGERAGWTVAQVLLGLLATELGGIQAWWAAPIAMGISAAKTYVQHRLPAKATEG